MGERVKTSGLILLVAVIGVVMALCGLAAPRISRRWMRKAAGWLLKESRRKKGHSNGTPKNSLQNSKGRTVRPIRHVASRSVPPEVPGEFNHEQKKGDLQELPSHPQGKAEDGGRDIRAEVQSALVNLGMRRQDAARLAKSAASGGRDFDAALRWAIQNRERKVAA